MIRAGTVDELLSPRGKWVFVDVGFSRSPTCGIAVGTKPARNFAYGEAGRFLLSLAAHAPINLVIEAPLSVAFDKDGNPTGRRCETFKGKSRAWNLQGGTLVTLAALYMLRPLIEAFKERELVLYEGFVSFKSAATDHAADAEVLRFAVFNGIDSVGGRIWAKSELKKLPSDQLSSTLELFGLEVDVPPVICVFG